MSFGTSKPKRHIFPCNVLLIIFCPFVLFSLGHCIVSYFFVFWLPLWKLFFLIITLFRNCQFQTSIYLIDVINKMNCELMLTYDTPALRQTGSRNLTGPKTLPTIWHTYMKLVTKYQISAINSCWEKCNEKWAYMFNVYKNQQSRQTWSRNLMGPKTLPTIWYTYMTLVTKYQISGSGGIINWFAMHILEKILTFIYKCSKNTYINIYF